MIRRTFVTSRNLDFFTVENLAKQIGHDRHNWGMALIKELIDNGLDACETSGVTPEIKVVVDPEQISVQDNGPGLPGHVIEKALDYNIRVSDKGSYISPSRGQQGNALKTIFAAPCVLGEGTGATIIDSMGVHRTIEVRLDPIDQCPRIVVNEEPGFVKNGALVSLGSACLIGASLLDFYKRTRELLAGYAGLNPHATFRLSGAGDPETFEARCPGWKKWTPDRPTSAHWYTPAQFVRLIASHLADDRTSGRITTIREFLAEFAGLKATQIQKQIAQAVGLSGGRLDTLLTCGEIDPERTSKLLSLMTEYAKPIEPQQLGVMGRNIVQAGFAPWGFCATDVSYKSERGFLGTRLPVSIEMGLAIGTGEMAETGQQVVFGINFSPALTNPDDHFLYTMQRNYIDADDPVKILVNVVYPHVQFTDTGKAHAELPGGIRDALKEMLDQLAKPWKKHVEKWHRARQREERRAYAPPVKERKMSLKAAAYQILETAYLKASGNGQYPANARQIMYAARPQILRMTGKDKLDDAYFIQTLLPDFRKDFAELTRDWNVVYDARGHLRVPHDTGEIGLGTHEVRQYVSTWEWNAPEHAYGTVLFIEKEGFDALLDQSQIAQEYDLAIMSTKGMSVTASRELIEALTARDEGIRILVLHDFDAYGFGICHTLWNDGRRHTFETRPEVLDLGLRLDDVTALGLESEPCSFREDKDPKGRLRVYGCTEAECDFLVRRGFQGTWEGDRVELNALTSDQFVIWLKEKLDLHGVGKVVPDENTLVAAYRDAVRQAHIERVIQEARRTQPRDDEINVPDGLVARVSNILRDTKALAWTHAVREIVDTQQR